jgi:hypothetical protein
MSEGRTAAGTARRAGSGPTRLVRAWRALPHESRLAAFASLALFLTLFLPWYQVTLIAPAKTATLQSVSATITGWGAFSFVEAAVLLVAAGVVTLLFQRAEGRAFHLPGGDGGVITAAGLWTCLLIVWRIFDKQGATTNGPSATTSGVEWGIFIALAAGAFLAYSGSRIRAAHLPEPPLPGENGAPAGSSAAATVVRPPRGEAPARERPRRRARPPMPVPADPPARAERPTRSDPPAPAERPTRSDPPLWAGDPAPPFEARHDRPRRRPGASELFERVVPEDPPTMPFGRAKRSDTDLTVRRLDPPPPASEDDTLALGEDATTPLGDDATLPLGDDATVRLGRDATVPLGDDDTRRLDR